jgi:hypothetical protein
MKTRTLLTLIAVMLLVLILGACAPQSTAAPGGGDEMPAPVLNARAWLAAQLGINVDQVEIVDFTTQDWTDSCLGLGGAAESCLQAITPGYQVTLRAGGQEYEVRTNAAGDGIRSPQFPN